MRIAGLTAADETRLVGDKFAMLRIAQADRLGCNGPPAGRGSGRPSVCVTRSDAGASAVLPLHSLDRVGLVEAGKHEREAEFEPMCIRLDETVFLRQGSLRPSGRFLRRRELCQ